LTIIARHEHDALLRITSVLELVQVSRSAWWAGVKTGRFPEGVKLGPRTTRWRKSDIEKLIASLA
jgi:prophage regulatory protein